MPEITGIGSGISVHISELVVVVYVRALLSLVQGILHVFVLVVSVVVVLLGDEFACLFACWSGGVLAGYAW